MNPVPVMKGLEIIRGIYTSDDTYNTTMALAQKMGKEIRNASDMIQNFLDQQPRAVSVSTLRKALPISFTVLVMALDWLGREGRVSVERSGTVIVPEK